MDETFQLINHGSHFVKILKKKKKAVVSGKKFSLSYVFEKQQWGKKDVAFKSFLDEGRIP